MAKQHEINAKLAEVVTPTQLAFNAGSDKGVAKGDTVTLFRTVKITDPESKEPLGAVRISKLTLTVSLVEQKYCIADVTDTGTNSGQNITYGTYLSTYNTTQVTTNPTNPYDQNLVRVQIGEDASIMHKIS